MNPNDFFKPHQLERNSFLWSQVRLVVAAVALFLGGVPPVLFLVRTSTLTGLVRPGLTLAWLVSGAVSAYLLYRWMNNGYRVFGGTDQKDRVAFLVSVISGINLGLTAILGYNPGMSVNSTQLAFLLVGIIYLLAAYHLHKRWKATGQHLF